MSRSDAGPRSGPAPASGALTLVGAQAVSALGSAVTGFAMNVWVFEKTGSYTVFSVLTIVGALPALVLAPVAGVIVDRWDRRRILAAGQAAGAGALSLTALASGSGALSPALVGVLLVLVGTVNAVNWPAVGASLSLLAPPESRGRVNGVSETLMGTVTVGAPVAGAALYAVVGVTGIALCDAASYVICLGLVLLLRFPALPARPSGGPGRSVYAVFRADLAAGLRWLGARRDLVRLLLFFVAVNVGLSIFTVLYSPYVLSFGSPRLLGTLLALVGAGAVAGGMAYSATGGPADKERGVLAGALALGLCMLVFGLTRSESVLCAAAFGYGAAVPLLNASSQTIWQAQVPPEMQGRIFSLRRMIAWSLNPVSILVSVPLARLVATPLVARGSFFAGIWGTQAPGRFGLMASCCGLLCAAIAVATLLFGGLRIAVPEVLRVAEQAPH